MRTEINWDKRANIYYPNNDITGILKNDIICWIIVKVNEITDSEKIINDRLKFKIPSETIIEDKNNSERFITGTKLQELSNSVMNRW